MLLKYVPETSIYNSNEGGLLTGPHTQHAWQTVIGCDNIWQNKGDLGSWDVFVMMILLVWQPIGWISLQIIQYSNAHTKVTK